MNILNYRNSIKHKHHVFDLNLIARYQILVYVLTKPWQTVGYLLVGIIV